MDDSERTHSSKPPRRRRPRRRKPRQAPPEGPRREAPPGENDGIRAVADRVERDITRLFYTLVESRKGATGDRSPNGRARLRLELDVEPDGGSGQILQALQREAERYLDDRAEFPVGRVYCHWCRSYQCEHSAPPDHRSVFGGYSATGQPVWRELISLLVEKRDPRVDLVVGDAPTPVAVVQAGGELSVAQLAVYGKRSPIYRILGQVAVGYVPLPDSGGGRGPSMAAGQPLAITFQAVVTGNGSRPPALNILGRRADGKPAFEALEESSDVRLGDALASARRSLAGLPLAATGVRRRRREGERKGRVLAVLTRLARNLERIFRQKSRRTVHAQDRHLDRARPASTALRDALNATPDSVYRDVEERTWVIVGPRNRVHVFNDQALHVTSVTYAGETVRQRTTRGKWVSPKRDEATSFLATLRHRASVR